LISKTILSLATGVYFGKKEEYMGELNKFIEEYKPFVEDFLDRVLVSFLVLLTTITYLHLSSFLSMKTN